MQLPALVFPHTALRRSTLAALAPLFEPVMIMEPPTLEPAAATPLIQAGLARVLRPGPTQGPQAHAEALRARAMHAQWEHWLLTHQGSGRAEALKAGLELPDPHYETRFDIMGELKHYGRRAPEPAADLAPEVPPELWLHLIHLQDQQASEMEDLLARAEAGQAQLKGSIGLDEEDYQPAGYEEGFLDRLPPVSYGLDEERLLARRLGAWASLAARLEDGAGVLATASLPAAQWLLERANRRLLPPDEARSPAGAAALPARAAGEPDPALPLAQEALRLVLPDLAGLDEEGLMGLRARLIEAGSLDQARSGLAGLLARLEREPWSAGLKAELGEQARSLAEDLALAMDQAGSGQGGGQRSLSVLAFPGLKRADLLALMAGAGDQGLPRLDQWPGGWPAGSLPLVAIW